MAGCRAYTMWREQTCARLELPQAGRTPSLCPRSITSSKGLPAVGMFGLIRAAQKPGPWGLVGNNVRADPVALNAILEAGRLPVIPALALGETSLLNVNGDETPAAVAVALESSELVFLTDVEGVKDADGMVLDRAAAPDELLAASFVSGGMIPKLRAVKAATDGGGRMLRVGRTRFGRIS